MILKIVKKVVIINEIFRQGFDDLKNDVKELKKVFDKVNSIALSIEKITIEIKYIKIKKIAVAAVFFYFVSILVKKHQFLSFSFHI